MMNAGIEIRVEPDETAALQAAADALMETARSAAAAAGCASIAISGGNTPRGMHRLLARAPYAAGISWDRVHFFWADERMVPYEDPASNFGAAQADFLEILPQPPAGVHAIPADGDPEAAARRYEEALRQHFQQLNLSEPVFDLICLGLGADGHTASLFPGSPVLSEPRRWAAACKGGVPDVWRITLTLSILNRARRIVFLVTGEGKAAAVRHVLSGSWPILPAQQVCPPAGRTTWVLDRAAASLLSHSLFYV
jgi:6-phosphogluconolactonase